MKSYGKNTISSLILQDDFRKLMSQTDKRWALIGMPGSGKSTLLKNLSHHLACTCVDLDAELEHQERLTIQALWNFYGEDQFRTMERKSLFAVLSKPIQVIACGGGTIGFMDSFHRLKSFAKTIYLEVPIQQLALRLLNTQGRPLLQTHNLIEIEIKLNKIFLLRKAIFEQADFTIQADTDELMLVKKVKNILEM